MTENIKERINYFSVYDFFGYLAPGLLIVVLLVLEYDISELLEYYVSNHPPSLKGVEESELFLDSKLNYLVNFLTWGDNANFKFVPFVLLIFSCYLGGHLIAAISYFVIERTITQHFIGFPSRFLLLPKKKFRLILKSNNYLFNIKSIILYFQRFLVRVVFKKYTRPMSSRKLILEKLKRKFGRQVGMSECYWLVYSYLSHKNGMPFKRVTHFLNLYGFNRNCSMTFLLYVSLRIIACFTIDSHINKYSCFILILFGLSGFVLFLNYLKLFRRQATEMYYQFLNYECNNDKFSIGLLSTGFGVSSKSRKK